MHTRAGRMRRVQAPKLQFKLPAQLLALLAAPLLAGPLLAGPLLAAPLGPAHEEPTVADPTQLVVEMLTARAAAEFPNASISADTVPLDPRLKLAPCGNLDLQPRGTQLYGRIPVAVRCLAPQPWSVFITADVQVTLPVVVTKGPLERGTLITANDLQLVPKNVASLRRQYLTDLDSAAGLEVTRTLPARSVVYPALLRAPLAIRKGDRVALLAQRGAVTIQVRGEALRDGMVGAQIPVRNRQSERTVYGWIRSPGVVAVQPERVQ